MSDKQDIRRALEQQLENGTYTGITSATDIAWENVTFNPTAKSAWIRPKLIMSERKSASIGVNSANRFDGLFLVDCFVKQNTGGTAALDDLADDILDQFTNGLVLTENSNRIHILSAEQTGGFVLDAPWVFQPITITFYTYIA